MSGENARRREQALHDEIKVISDKNHEFKVIIQTMLNNIDVYGSVIECNVEKAKRSINE